MEPNLEEGAVSIGVSVWRPNLDITKGHSFLVGNPTGGPTGVLGTVAVDPRMPLDLFRDVISTERSGRIRKRRSWFQEALSSIQEVDNFFGRPQTDRARYRFGAPAGQDLYAREAPAGPSSRPGDPQEAKGPELPVSASSTDIPAILPMDLERSTTVAQMVRRHPARASADSGEGERSVPVVCIVPLWAIDPESGRVVEHATMQVKPPGEHSARSAGSPSGRSGEAAPADGHQSPAGSDRWQQGDRGQSPSSSSPPSAYLDAPDSMASMDIDAKPSVSAGPSLLGGASAFGGAGAPGSPGSSGGESSGPRLPPGSPMHAGANEQFGTGDGRASRGSTSPSGPGHGAASSFAGGGSGPRDLTEGSGHLGTHGSITDAGPVPAGMTASVESAGQASFGWAGSDVAGGSPAGGVADESDRPRRPQL